MVPFKCALESEWPGLEGTLRMISFQSPAMGRDVFCYLRLLQALSNLALSNCRNGTATASLGNLFYCLITLTRKNFFLLSKPTFSQFEGIPPCPVAPDINHFSGMVFVQVLDLLLLWRLFQFMRRNKEQREVKGISEVII